MGQPALARGVLQLVNARTLLGAMIVGSVIVLLAVPRRGQPRAATVAPRVAERPWLTREAAAELFGPDGTLGPLFADVTLGGPAPSPATRARIAAFAQHNDVEIRFEVEADELKAIRFAVTFGGCCGYEGADTLGRKLGRPRTWTYCGSPPDWVDDWSVTSDNVHLLARVRVNRLEVRWEPTVTLPELLDRAEQLLGSTRSSVRDASGDRWIETGEGHYLLEVPYGFVRDSYGVERGLRHRPDLGLQIVVDRGRITELSFELRDLDVEAFADLLRTRWGRPSYPDKNQWLRSWQLPHGHRFTADYDGLRVTVVLAKTGLPADGR